MRPSEEEELARIADELGASDPRLGRALRHLWLPDVALAQVIDPYAAAGTAISLVALLSGVLFALPVLVALGILIVPFTVTAMCLRHPRDAVRPGTAPPDTPPSA